MKFEKKRKDKSLKRKHPQTFYFNERELSVFNQYCKKYKVKNRAKFMREAIVTAILKKFDEDYPSLFDQPHSKANNPSLFTNENDRDIS
jgi:hypothetical protein